MNGRARASARARNSRVWARKGASTVAVVLVLAFASLAAGTVAFRFPEFASLLFAPSPYAKRTSPPGREVAQENTDYNGQFIFVRLRYADGMSGMGGFGRRGRGNPGWYHDYPDAEQNITKLLAHITSVIPGAIGGNILDVGDPELHRYPIAYMSEPGYWDMNDQEVANLRSYLLKGGFLIFDDFPNWAWPNFEAQMKRMLPELEPIELKADHRIFNTFFEFESLDNLYGSYQGRPYFYAYFLGNDPTKRMLAMVNFQNDLGESWEYRDIGFSVIGDAAIAEAYKFGINYILYGLIH